MLRDRIHTHIISCYQILYTPLPRWFGSIDLVGLDMSEANPKLRERPASPMPG